MDLNLTGDADRYPRPRLLEPPTSGYLYLGAAVSPPSGPPLVRPSRRRSALVTRLDGLARQLRELETVRCVSIYRAVLMPPVGGDPRTRPRDDVVVLIETTDLDALEAVRASPVTEQLLAAMSAAATAGVHTMQARCLRFLGEVDRTRQGLFLFNHFNAVDRELATRLWEYLAGWYVAETGLDNSTLLQPVDDTPRAFVNHARWDTSLIRFAAQQFGTCSFYSYVRANLRAHGVVAMPVLYRLAVPARDTAHGASSSA